jgi:hypothetical protein
MQTKKVLPVLWDKFKLVYGGVLVLNAFAYLSTIGVSITKKEDYFKKGMPVAAYEYRDMVDGKTSKEDLSPLHPAYFGVRWINYISNLEMFGQYRRMKLKMLMEEPPYPHGARVPV